MTRGGASSRTLPAGLVLAVAVLAVSWASILVRLCEAPSLAIAGWRMILSTLILLPIGFRRTARTPPAIWWSAGAAGFLLAVHFATWISSLAFTSVASSVALVSTQPVFTAVLSPWLLDERPSSRGVAAVMLTLLGSAVMAGTDYQIGARAVVGDLLALVGAASASGYLIIGRRVRQGIALGPYLLAVYAVSAATLVALAAAVGAPLAGYPTATWVWLFLMAAGPGIAGHGLLNWSVRRLRALTVNLAILGEPVLATLLAVAVFKEIPAPGFYPGALLLGGGIALAAAEESRRAAP